MIMGAGKTTVVGPLLSLLLANGSQLVVQVSFLFLFLFLSRPGHLRALFKSPLLSLFSSLSSPLSLLLSLFSSLSSPLSLLLSYKNSSGGTTSFT